MSARLGARLARLRREAGTPAQAGDAPGPAALAERIARLGRRRDLTPELAGRLGGRCLEEGVLQLRSRAELGAWPGEALRSFGLEAEMAGRLRFVDTETTGLAGGAGTLVFLFGSGRVVGDELEVEQLLLLRPGAEAAFWRCAAASLGERYGLVSYNGKAFDWPLVASRRCLARQRALPPPEEHLDLLHPVRRAFGSSWPDCRLSTCEEQLLAFRRVGDPGGALAPSAYRDFLAGRSVEPLLRIVRHHHRDILSLGLLLPRVAAALEEPDRHGADVVAVARLWLRRGERARARRLLDGRPERKARHLLADLHRRAGQWDRAAELWDGLAAEGDVLAAESLAKYHEHRRRSFRKALHYCEMLIALEPQQPRHQRRHERLGRRLGAAP